MFRRTHPKSDTTSTELAGDRSRAGSGENVVLLPSSGARTRTAGGAAASSGPTLTRLALILIVLGLASAAIAVALFFSAGGGAASPDCTWGASSVAYVNGHLVRGPELTGCAP